MNPDSKNPWLKLASTSLEDQWSLICFPFAAGFAEYFLPWSKKLTQCAFYPIQLPGRSFRWYDTIFNYAKLQYTTKQSNSLIQFMPFQPQMILMLPTSIWKLGIRNPVQGFTWNVCRGITFI